MKTNLVYTRLKTNLVYRLACRACTDSTASSMNTNLQACVSSLEPVPVLVVLLPVSGLVYPCGACAGYAACVWACVCTRVEPAPVTRLE